MRVHRRCHDREDNDGFVEIVLSLPYTVSLDLDDHQRTQGHSAINALYHTSMR
jgi:hypothetical protein